MGRLAFIFLACALITVGAVGAALAVTHDDGAQRPLAGAAPASTAPQTLATSPSASTQPTGKPEATSTPKASGTRDDDRDGSGGDCGEAD